MIDISNVTVQGPHVGSYRTTKYELRFLHVGPNSVGLEVTERGVMGSSPIRVEVPESLYTPEQMATIHAAMSLLEEGFRVVHDAKEEELKLAGVDIPRAEVHKLVKDAEAAKLEKARIEAENIVQRAEHEERAQNMATLQAAAEAQLKATRDAHEAEMRDLAAKRETARAELAELEAKKTAAGEAS